MKVLVFTTLYPNDVATLHGVFVETRILKLAERHRVSLEIVAPVPWFPFGSRRFGRYGALARVSRAEKRSGLSVSHPRYVLLPKVGMVLAPLFLALSGLLACRRARRGGFDFDVIDAHYIYPDGVAAAIVGRVMGKPVVVSARGSDLNVISRYRAPRAMMRWAMRRAGHVVTVSAALREEALAVGADPARVTVVPNGVDTTRFAPPRDRAFVRRELGFSRTTLLSVGRLVPIKGHDLILRALAGLPDSDLIIVGDGPEEPRLFALAREMGVEDRVTIRRSLPQDELKNYYGAADMLILASANEGWPNVLLESIACGTPVVATRVGGVPEIVTAPAAGVVVERSVASLRAGVRQLESDGPRREDTRAFSTRFDWGEAVDGLYRILHECSERARVPPP